MMWKRPIVRCFHIHTLSCCCLAASDVKTRCCKQSSRHARPGSYRPAPFHFTATRYSCGNCYLINFALLTQSIVSRKCSKNVRVEGLLAGEAGLLRNGFIILKKIREKISQKESMSYKHTRWLRDIELINCVL
jgi:hypothetical protein